MNITFFLLGQKGFECLSQLPVNYYQKVEQVVYGQDSNIKNDYSDEIIALCKERSIKCVSRLSFIEGLSELNFAIGWRWLILNPANKKIIVLHDSLLPKYRGFNPLVTALINGDTTIGVTALFANEEYDKGEIIYQESIAITYPILIQQAIDLISPLYQLLVYKIIEQFEQFNVVKSFPQNENDATYSLWRNEDDYFIDWDMDAICIKRMIDAVGSPYAGAKTKLNEMIIGIVAAEVVPDVKIANRKPGKLIWKQDNCAVIVCGKGLLKITCMQEYSTKINYELKNFRIKFY